MGGGGGKNSDSDNMLAVPLTNSGTFPLVKVAVTMNRGSDALSGNKSGSGGRMVEVVVCSAG
jgi:hypothetical protein